MHQAGLKIMVILLLLPQKSWDYKLCATTPCSICFFLKLETISYVQNCMYHVPASTSWCFIFFLLPFLLFLVQSTEFLDGFIYLFFLSKDGSLWVSIRHGFWWCRTCFLAKWYHQGYGDLGSASLLYTVHTRWLWGAAEHEGWEACSPWPSPTAWGQHQGDPQHEGCLPTGLCFRPDWAAAETGPARTQGEATEDPRTAERSQSAQGWVGEHAPEVSRILDISSHQADQESTAGACLQAQAHV